MAPLLERIFTHAELESIHHALVSSIPPAEMMVFVRAMIPAFTREERAQLLSRVEHGAPPHILVEVMNEARRYVSEEDIDESAERMAPDALRDSSRVA